MAIVINAKDFLGVPNTNFNGPAIRQTINISVADTGEVNSDIINLGNQGDDGVTIIHFNLSERLMSMVNSGNYQSMIVSIDDNGVTTTNNFNGVDFYVPNTITRLDGAYRLVYVVHEKEQETNGNIESETEIFTSAIFEGVVQSTNYPLIDEPEELPQISETSFTKPKVVMSYKGSTEMVDIGYSMDKFIRYIEIGDANELLSQYVLYFTGYVKDAESNELAIKTIGYYCDENNRCWIPPTVTQNPGDWQVMIVGYADNGYEYYSDVFVVNVIDNELRSLSLNDLVLDSNLLSLADENNNPILVLRPGIGSNYVLRFAGEEINTLLDAVQTGDQTVNRAIGDENGNIISTTYATKNEIKSLKDYIDSQIQATTIEEF